jgi:hypothetical protein
VGATNSHDRMVVVKDQEASTSRGHGRVWMRPILRSIDTSELSSPIFQRTSHSFFRGIFYSTVPHSIRSGISEEYLVVEVCSWK